MKKVLYAILVIVAVLSIVAILYFNNLANSIIVKSQSPAPTTQPGVTLTPTPTPDPLAPANILLLGYGGAGHEGGYLTDTIIIAHIVPRSRKVVLITIPRDVWVEIRYDEDEPEYFKINHAYSIGVDNKKFPDKLDQYRGVAGGGNLAEEAVETITGLPVNNFVSVNFQGFQNIVDILGGVEVYVPYTFDDEFYPLKGEENNPCEKTEQEIEVLMATMSGELLEKQFSCRYEKLHFDKGLQTLDSELALKFVRSRHSEVGGGDFGRSQRQLAFIEGIKNKLLNYRSVFSLIPVLNQFADNVRTDLDLKSGFGLLKSHGDLSGIDITTISLNDDNVFTNS
ncbi:LCP family protein, partial [Patescibacteria group bacterium]